MSAPERSASHDLRRSFPGVASGEGGNMIPLPTRTSPVTVQTIVLMPNNDIPLGDKISVLKVGVVHSCDWIKSKEDE